jgi:hypothetical protein
MPPLGIPLLDRSGRRDVLVQASLGPPAGRSDRIDDRERSLLIRAL